MTTTPIWVPLVVAAIGVAGVMFTQWRSDLRERNRIATEERREERRLARDAERDHDSRLFDHRRTLYASVIDHYHRWSSVAGQVSRGEVPEPPHDAMDGFWVAVGEVDLYGGQEVASRALHLLFAVSDLVYQTGSSDDPAWDASDRYYEFLDAARTELGVPPRRRPRRDQKPEA